MQNALSDLGHTFCSLNTVGRSVCYVLFCIILILGIEPEIVGGVQCDQIGRFFKFLGNNFSYNSNPNIW